VILSPVADGELRGRQPGYSPRVRLSAALADEVEDHLGAGSLGELDAAI
jgi:hypothetical protein